MSAVFSSCHRYRYRLERDVLPAGNVVAYFGVNPSTAAEEEDDHTSRKMIGFAERLGARRYILGNVFAWCAKDVDELADIPDPFGPDNDRHVRSIIRAADLLIPCWGSRLKLPLDLRGALDAFKDVLRRSGKPMRSFGLTKSGDPKHPLTLSYATRMLRFR
ncbi:MAG TPA: DUF1643 domain-containing protein [Rudaea sp.]|nr:DUF1643 domain-containing protein [Rudaea sp.]